MQDDVSILSESVIYQRMITWEDIGFYQFHC